MRELTFYLAFILGGIQGAVVTSLNPSLIGVLLICLLCGLVLAALAAGNSK